MFSSLFAIASPAFALEPVRLAWVRGEGAEGCASQQTIADGVTARLGEGAISTSAARSIEAVVAKASAGFRVVLYVRNADGSLAGSRELTSETDGCGSIEAASVLAIALAIDPDAATRPPPIASSPSPPPGPAPVKEGPSFTLQATPLAPSAPSSTSIAPPSIAPAPVSSTRRPLPLALTTDTGGAGISLRAGLGIGLLPSPFIALEIGGYVAVGPRVEITGQALWMPEDHAADRRFAFGLTAIGLGVCGTLTRGRAYDFALCGTVWGGSLHAVVFDLAPVSPGDSAWAALSLTPRVRVRLTSRAHLDLGLHVLVPLVRRPFELADGTAIFQQSIVTVTPLAGVGVHFF